MKKTLLAVLGTVCIMGIGCNMYVDRIVTNYENKLYESNSNYEVLNKVYNQKVSDYDKLDAKHEELENEVYKLMNGENYDLTIRVNSETHTFTYEKENFLFANKTHTVTRLN